MLIIFLLTFKLRIIITPYYRGRIEIKSPLCSIVCRSSVFRKNKNVAAGRSFPEPLQRLPDRNDVFFPLKTLIMLEMDRQRSI